VSSPHRPSLFLWLSPAPARHSPLPFLPHRSPLAMPPPPQQRACHRCTALSRRACAPVRLPIACRLLPTPIRPPHLLPVHCLPSTRAAMSPKPHRAAMPHERLCLCRGLHVPFLCKWPARHYTMGHGQGISLWPYFIFLFSEFHQINANSKICTSLI
jgi:hypothetical protein